jgi:hypothetical protein
VPPSGGRLRRKEGRGHLRCCPPGTTVIGAGNGGTLYEQTSGSDCLKDEAGACITPTEKCGSQRADVIVDSTGKVVDIICHPASTEEPTRIVNGTTENIQAGNNEVIYLGGDGSAPALEGDLTLEGNNTRLVANRVVGNLKNGGENTFCDDNRKFSDANGNSIAEASELGETFDCKKE